MSVISVHITTLPNKEFYQSKHGKYIHLSSSAILAQLHVFIEF
jgi:hypothetical protein